MKQALRRGSSLVLGGTQQAPPTFRVVHVGDDTKNEQSLSKEPHRVGPPATGPGHMTNEVVTSKYTAVNFMVKNLWEQFHRPANVYFLGISILQCIKAISITGGTPTTLAPLTAVLIATSTKDGIEDFSRHQADAQENSRMVTRLVMAGQRSRRSSTGNSSAKRPAATKRKRSGGSLNSGGGGGKRPPGVTEQVSWMDVQVGDVLEIRNRENIPADLVMLSCSDPKGTCFVMTSNLDGETNLKPRMVSPDLRAAVAAAGDAAEAGGGGEGGVLALAAKGASVECDLPNQKLEHFDGTLAVPGGSRMPLHGKNILLRGCQLRNTEWCRGVVVYTGRETKIQMNAAEPAPKSSSLKPYVDWETLRVLCVQIFLCLIGAIFAGVRAAGADVKNMYFIWGEDGEPQSPALTAFLKFWSFIIIFTNFVPISLLVTLDMVKIFQSKLIGWDRQMYHEAREFDGTKRPMPAQVRSSELNEDLGRVKHIFTDKTGTLTCNIMNFRKCSIGGQMFGLGTTEIGLNYRLRNHLPVPTVPSLPPGAKQTPHVNFIDPEFARVVENKAHPTHAAAAEFYLHLALNHEVQPEQQSDGSVVYSASNPDEGALIYAASHFGHRFLRRDGKDVMVAITRRREQPLLLSPSSKPTSSGTGGAATFVAPLLPPPVSIVGGRADAHDGAAGVAASGEEGPEEDEQAFRILHTFPFTSDRKRSSVVVRRAGAAEGSVTVYCKGADNVMLERLDPAKNPADLVRAVKDNIAEFTRDGLRTLLTAKTERSEEEYTAWLTDFQAAETSMQGREEKLKAAMEVMEQGLEVQGVTAIEDKLQDGVPDALNCLRSAGTKVWMLTGDKVDTAINIGHSCSLLNTDMTTLRLCAEDEEEEEEENCDSKSNKRKGGQDAAGGVGKKGKRVEEEAVVVKVERTALELDAAGIPSEASLRGLMGELTAKAAKLSTAAAGESGTAIVVDTYALSGISQHGLENDFVFLCGLCASVVCARVSPRQKSLVVGMVRAASPNVVTLSVGDGANDVPMLQSAHVGVGIHGLEGAQAVNNSDYSLGQFRFLKKLLLVHGRWSYRRVCKVTVYMFYKNALLVLPQFFFAFLSLSSGQNFYYDLLYQSYNVFFTSLPIIALGDVTSEVVLAHPVLYQDGVQRVFLTPRIFWRWMGEGALHAAIVTFLPMAALGAGGVLPEGRGVGLWGLGLVVFFCVVVVANGRVAMENKLWTVVFASVFALSLATFVVCWAFFSEIPFFSAGLPQISGTMRMMGGSAWFWLTVIVTASAALLLSYFGIAWSALFCPTRDVVGQEISSIQRRREAAEKRIDRQPLSMRKGQVLPLMVSPSPSNATKWSLNDR
ncbi:unnamed protein product, partial [Scytosiphon promiscuus]